MHRDTRRAVALRMRGIVFAFGTLLAAPELWAQGVLLRVHPRVGDTLHTRLDQRTEMTASLPVSPGITRKSVITSVTLSSRSIVQASSPASTLVLTIVDSADLKTSDEHGAAQVAAAERTLRGQQLVLQLGADGAVEQARDARGGPSRATSPTRWPRCPRSFLGGPCRSASSGCGSCRCRREVRWVRAARDA
jgi:hypothetical protein